MFLDKSEVQPMHHMLLRVKRFNGLGNVIMLLPVLLKAVSLGKDTTLITRPEWIDALSPWCPGVKLTSNRTGVTHDLDKLTESTLPRAHRTYEFGCALSIPGPFTLLSSFKPNYGASWASAYSGAILFAPEAGHKARQWPIAYANALAERLLGSPLVLIGLSQTPSLPCDFDLRGKLSLTQLFELVSTAGCVVSMDSGTMQVALSLTIPVVSIFGGIDPTYRVLPSQNARVLVADIECRPCNKQEMCKGEYPCLTSIRARDVLEAVQLLDDFNRLDILITQ
jgi:hypothetical protein